MSNEAAERLLTFVRNRVDEGQLSVEDEQVIREALAAERKVMVERIRAAIEQARDREGSGWRWSVPQQTLRVLDAILDAEAAR